MTASQVMTVKPDACIVDFYNEVAASFMSFSKRGEYIESSV